MINDIGFYRIPTIISISMKIKLKDTGKEVKDITGERN